MPGIWLYLFNVTLQESLGSGLPLISTSTDRSNTEDTDYEDTEFLYNQSSWHKRRDCYSAKRSPTPVHEACYISIDFTALSDTEDSRCVSQTFKKMIFSL